MPFSVKKGTSLNSKGGLRIGPQKQISRKDVILSQG